MIGFCRTIEQLRLLVFASWLVFAVIVVTLPLPLLSDPRMADADTYLRLTKVLTGLWLPSIACFAGFWFGADDHETTPGLRRETVLATTSLTLLYFAICILVVSLVLFRQNYDPDPETNAVAGASIDQRLASAVAWLQLLSPVFLAPIGYLTAKPQPKRGAAGSTGH